MTMIFFLLKRGSNANVAIDIPYPVFLYVGLVVWFTWVETVGSVASSGRINAALMSKVYFPRLYSPMSQAAGTALRTLIGLVPMVILMAWFGVLPGWEIAYVPALLLHSAVLAFAVGTIFGILAIDSSDWNSFRGLVLYVGLFLTPVIYPIDMVPEGYRLVFMLNPAVGVVDGFRGAMVDAHPFHYQAWLISTAVTGLLTIIAVVLFKRTEAHMLDEL
jgi:lipopolysaccharide transport system permease protein